MAAKSNRKRKIDAKVSIADVFFGGKNEQRRNPKAAALVVFRVVCSGSVEILVGHFVGDGGGLRHHVIGDVPLVGILHRLHATPLIKGDVHFAGN